MARTRIKEVTEMVIFGLALLLSLPALGQIADSPPPRARDTVNLKSPVGAKPDLPLPRDEANKRNDQRLNAAETKQRESETSELDELYDEVMRRSAPPVGER